MSRRRNTSYLELHIPLLLKEGEEFDVYGPNCSDGAVIKVDRIFGQNGGLTHVGCSVVSGRVKQVITPPEEHRKLNKRSPDPDLMAKANQVRDQQTAPPRKLETNNVVPLNSQPESNGPIVEVDGEDYPEIEYINEDEFEDIDQDAQLKPLSPPEKIFKNSTGLGAGRREKKRLSLTQEELAEQMGKSIE